MVWTLVCRFAEVELICRYVWVERQFGGAPSNGICDVRWKGGRGNGFGEVGENGVSTVVEPVRYGAIDDVCCYTEGVEVIEFCMHHSWYGVWMDVDLGEQDES